MISGLYFPREMEVKILRQKDILHVTSALLEENRKKLNI